MARDTTALLAATLSLASLSSLYLLTPRSSSAPPPTDTPLSTSPSTPDSDGDREKRYDIKAERYSASSGRWEELPTKDDDDDNDEEGKRKVLFTACKRIWPKSREYEGYEDYLAVALHSALLVHVLREDVPALKGCEEVFEDEPEVDARDLFLAEADVRKALEGKKREVQRGKEEGDAENTKGEAETSTPAVANGTVAAGEEDDLAEEEKPLLPVAQEKQTQEELEETVDHLEVLLKWLDETFEPTRAKLSRLLHPSPSHPSPSSAPTLPNGATQPSPSAQISFALLWAVFVPDSLAVAEHEVSGEKYAFRVREANYNMTHDGMVFQLSGIALHWTGEKYTRMWVDAKIPKFKSLRRLASLPVIPLAPSSKQHADLSARGRRYCELTGAAGGGSKFLNYDGVLMFVQGCGMDRRVVKLRAEGRAVVDVKSYRRMNPSRSDGTYWEDDDDSDSPFLWGDPSLALHPSSSSPSSASHIADSELCLLPPTVYGFSLTQREWGELSVLGFSEIEFRDKAWEMLVLEGRTKELVRGLVENNEAVRRVKGRERRARREEEEGESGQDGGEEQKAVVGDVIEGKGGGLVIALHGPPGVGKTLTAEAVAESLRVPLYTVGAGSLGVHADELERRLRDTLDVAEGWGAVLLIDEADVFLEERSRTDVARNAMVSVFLRMLEHHSGVLFLTTNRIRSIDEAFMSRFSLAITYPALDKSSRKLIYTHFLALAGVGIEDAAGSANAAPNEVKPAEGKSTISTKYLDRIAGYAGFNGRQIKNIVRTAQSLALSQSASLTETQLDVVIKTAQDFQRDLDEADEKGVYEAKGEGWKDRTNVFM
ncbi:hypothetical protein JCM8097_008312 [Rhodosporidiobolus ruineniae]